MTELSPLATVAPVDDAETCYGSSGRVVPATTIKIVDPRTRAELGVGEEGELLVSGPQVMLGYLNRPEATSETIVDGFVCTGDLAWIDERGNVFVGDRLKELIKVKGFQVAPAEVEGVILEHPDVLDCCVIGVPDERSGERPKAFVVLQPGATIDADELLAALKQKLAPYKVPQQVQYLDTIPKSASGKILRRKLRAG